MIRIVFRTYIVLIMLIVAIFTGCTTKMYVSRVIDGDTFETSDGEIVRLIGVNTPEKGEPCYEDAKLYVESQIFGRYVDVKTFGKDKYGRTLGEVYTSGKNLNTELIRRGYANAYLGDEEINWAEYVSAEEEGYLLGGCMWEGGWKRVCVGGEWKNGGFEIVNLCNVTIDTNVTIRDTSASHRINSVLLIEPYGRIRIDESCISDNKTIGICQHIFNKDGDELIIYDKEGLVVRIPYGKYKQG